MLKKSKKTLNFENLVNLGAEKLAELLLEISEGSAGTKQRLRLELSHALGSKALGSEVRKRLAAIKRSQRFIDFREQGTLIHDLETQCQMIIEKIAPDDPALAFDLLWQFLTLAESVYERVDDSNGYVGDVFRYAITLFDEIGPNSGMTADALAEKVFKALHDNDYGQYDDLITHLGPALGEAGLKTLKSIVQRYASEPNPDEANFEDNVTPIFATVAEHPIEACWPEERKSRFVTSCLQQIADQLGDVDAYIAQYTSEDLLNPNFAAQVATRLLMADRATEALAILTTSRDAKNKRFTPYEWNLAYVGVLDKLGHEEDLRAFRWQCFEETLDASYLRDLLKSLSDVDAIEVEDRAKDWAMQFSSFSSALDFFIEWPDLRCAADLILTRTAELNGDMYYYLTPAADKLQNQFPLACVLARRAMINYTLENAKATRYKHAVRHLLACRSSDKDIDDYKGFVVHKEFEEQLHTKHSRKMSFWNRLE